MSERDEHHRRALADELRQIAQLVERGEVVGIGWAAVHQASSGPSVTWGLHGEVGIDLVGGLSLAHRVATDRILELSWTGPQDDAGAAQGHGNGGGRSS